MTSNGITVLDEKFIYEGWNLIAEFNTSNQQVVRTNIWGLDVSGSLTAAGGVGGLLLTSLYPSGTAVPYYVAQDANGNVAALVSGSGAIVARYEYDAFGQTVNAQEDSGISNPFRFSGKYYDKETGLTYYGHRYYASSTGRFINRDPVGDAGGANLYAFVSNNGIDRWDYLGDTAADFASDSGTTPPLLELDSSDVQYLAYLAAHGADLTVVAAADKALPETKEKQTTSEIFNEESEAQQQRTEIDRSETDSPIAAETDQTKGSEAFPLLLAGTVKTGNTEAAKLGKAAHSAFGKGSQLAPDTITDRLKLTKTKAVVNELKPEGRLAVPGKLNQAINQLYRQMAAAEEKFTGKSIEGSLWIWQRSTSGFKYIKVMTIKMSDSINGLLIAPDIIEYLNETKEIEIRARQNNRSPDEEQRLEMLKRGPEIESAFGRIKNPYWNSIDFSKPEEYKAFWNGSGV